MYNQITGTITTLLVLYILLTLIVIVNIISSIHGVTLSCFVQPDSKVIPIEGGKLEMQIAYITDVRHNYSVQHC